ncbi:anaerobic ribonucleoside-triphosphate reductase activating protein [Cellulomonas sp. KRMCY2]|uniref:anaerobic ribonucleoside-triphosphate reductase activating protein n=1 Tax=Cellulomonas sp. KRMCY2 TaxID=1304865 RepID=UPI0004A2B623|nr:anaerobic ribonucleoside-triphosphate reductase activating protein [Cellulomonas sp. KRMCY2]
MTTPPLRSISPEVLWSADRLQIAGWTASSVVDWPGRTVLTVLLQGCPWECTYCETPELRSPMQPGVIPWRDVRAVVMRSRSGLDGVVFSGGEPTRQDGLADAMEQMREIGLPVALHTSGSYPQRLAAVLSLADRVVLEIKAPATLYKAITGVASSAHKAFASLRLALDSGVELQVRTTVDRSVLTDDDITRLRENLAIMGVRDHVVVDAVEPTVPGSA